MEQQLPFDAVVASLVDKQRRRRRNNVRYATDPQYREERQVAAHKWNSANPDRKRAADTKWAKTHGAAASKRYRQKKAANDNR